MPVDWDRRFLALAEHVAGWSKDPSTQVGCVLARPNHTVASVGYNGLPRGVVDSSARLADRATRLALTVHSEPNAIVAAVGSVAGCTAYTHPFPPCAACMGLMIQAGIVRVVAPKPSAALQERWGVSMALAECIAGEAGVECCWVPPC